MPTVDWIWIVIACILAMQALLLSEVSKLEKKVERILESGWFPEPREERK